MFFIILSDYTFDQIREKAPALSGNQLFESSHISRRFDPNVKSCPNKSPIFKFYNTTNGDELPLNCNRYSCPYCGPRKLSRLYKALVNYLKDEKYIRLWTFTLSSRVAATRSLHYKLFSECWRRLIIELRRNPLFSDKQHKFKYIRVCEPHKSGYFHYHVLFTSWFNVHEIQKIWDHICQRVTGDKFHVASCYVKGMIHSKRAASYVCKYVGKSADILDRYQKKWSKSAGPSIFPIRASSGEFILLRIDSDWSEYFNSNIFDSYFTCKDIESTSQDYNGLDPPINEIYDLFSGNQINGIDYSENVPIDLVSLGKITEEQSFKELTEFFTFAKYEL